MFEKIILCTLVPHCYAGILKPDCARRKSRETVFGQGFNSPRLHHNSPENGQSNPHLLVGRWGLLYLSYTKRLNYGLFRIFIQNNIKCS